MITVAVAQHEWKDVVCLVNTDFGTLFILVRWRLPLIIARRRMWSCDVLTTNGFAFSSGAFSIYTATPNTIKIDLARSVIVQAIPGGG